MSILWPVPEQGPLPSGYLKVFPKAGERGPYFPVDHADTFPDLHGDLSREFVQSTLAIIAMRVDPCAPSSSGTCMHELRITGETLDPGLTDAAMHLIYRLDDASFKALLVDLKKWRSHSPVPTGSRLTNHPGLTKAGISSPFAKELHDIVIRYATKETLVRVTVNSFIMEVWHFGRFDKAPSGWVRSPIPNLVSADAQAWARTSVGPGGTDDLDDPSGSIDPQPARSIAALHSVDALAGGATSAAVRQARDNVLFFENPRLSHAENTDCVSCHLANQTHRWAEAHGVSFAGVSNAYAAPAGSMVQPMSVHPSLKGNLGSTVAFGYHRIFNGPVLPEISTRVANETAETLARLNQ